MRKQRLSEYIAERNALFRNPTLEAATEYWTGKGFKFRRPDEALALTHKARLRWLDATDQMLGESLQWLKDHRYDTTTMGQPPFSPMTRDHERMRVGRAPLWRQ